MDLEHEFINKKKRGNSVLRCHENLGTIFSVVIFICLMPRHQEDGGVMDHKIYAMMANWCYF